MNYVKKMCILRQIKQGFSGDGKALSGLIKIEQYGKNLAVEVSVINFAPLASGEYYCLISDGKGKTEMLSLRGKSIFNILSDVDISGGFCGIVCYVKNDVVPIAYGVNGNGSYDWRTILNAALPPVFPRSEKSATGEIAGGDVTLAVSPQPNPPAPLYATDAYDDETVVTENYYEKDEKEKRDERELYAQADEDAHAESPTQKQGTENGTDLSQNEDAAGVLQPIKIDPDGYYLSVKNEIDELFRTYPRDKTLCGAFSCSEWVRIKGTAKDPQYLVGVLYDDGRARYVCYALAAADKNAPPEEIRNVCTFVPASVYDETVGFFVIFQSAASGECIKPERI